MTVRVRLHAKFLEDVESDLESVGERRHLEWFPLLEQELATLMKLLAAFPRVGHLRSRRDNRELRRFQLRRVPYSVWYVVDGEGVLVLGLAHARQRSPKPQSW